MNRDKTRKFKNEVVLKNLGNSCDRVLTAAGASPII